MKLFYRIGISVLLLATSCLVAQEAEEKSFAQFYHTKSGEMIMNPETFTEGIKAFLAEEDLFVLNLVINRYDYLFEIGCGLSERALDVTRFGKQFYGVDINPNFVNKSSLLFANKNIKERAQVQCFSVLDLNVDTFMLPKEKKSLIFFPFNIMGNLDDFHLVLENMVNIKQDFCFSTYKMNDNARVFRNGYYTNCGCQKLRYSTTPIGNLFDSQDGLHSASFKISYIVELLDTILVSYNKKAKIQINDLADVAFMIYVHDIEDL